MSREDSKTFTVIIQGCNRLTLQLHCKVKGASKKLKYLHTSQGHSNIYKPRDTFVRISPLPTFLSLLCSIITEVPECPIQDYRPTMLDGALNHRKKTNPCARDLRIKFKTRQANVTNNRTEGSNRTRIAATSS